MESLFTGKDGYVFLAPRGYCQETSARLQWGKKSCRPQFQGCEASIRLSFHIQISGPRDCEPKLGGLTMYSVNISGAQYPA